MWLDRTLQTPRWRASQPNYCDLRETQTENPWISAFYWSGGIHFIVYILIGRIWLFLHRLLCTIGCWNSFHLHQETFAHTNIFFHFGWQRNIHLYTDWEGIDCYIVWRVWIVFRLFRIELLWCCTFLFLILIFNLG